MKEIKFEEVGGFKVGHAQDDKRITGISVILFDEAAPAGIDVRGGGPASRDTQLLNPTAACQEINAIVLSGGSAFGLDATGGVMRYLQERNIGYDVGMTKVPLICQSALFDLGIGDFMAAPDQSLAREACENAKSVDISQGNVGVGIGCTVGKYHILDTEHIMKSGLGTYALEIDGLKVGAIVAVNALGDVYDIDTNEKIAGVRNDDGTLCTDESFYYNNMMNVTNAFTGNTTIGAIITNAKLDKCTLTKVASMAQNGYGRAIRPVHTMADGDSIYAASTGDFEADVNVVGSIAAVVMGRAIKNAVLNTKSLAGFKAACDICKSQ